MFHILCYFPFYAQNLIVGMKLYGYIQEIQATELIVSLPNMLHGYVPITNVHNLLTEQLQKSLNQNQDEDNDEQVILHFTFLLSHLMFN